MSRLKFSKKNPMLTPRQRAFCVEYLKSGNATDSYRKGFEPKNKNTKACSDGAQGLLSNPKVLTYLEELRAAVIEETKFEVADVLKRWIEIATADPNDIVQVQRNCCRYCHGIDHGFQWTRAEYAEAMEKAARVGQPMPSCVGGEGYITTAAPHPLCPQCQGRGIENIFIADSRTLTGKARLLYAGAKMTRHGIEVLLRNQDDALSKIAEHLGMFKKHLEVSGKNGAAPITLGTFTDAAEAAKVYQQIMTG